MDRNIIFKIIFNIFLLLLIFPLFIILLWSFTKIWPWPDLFPKAFGLRGFQYLLNPSNNSLKILGCSIWLSTVVMFVAILISIPAAKALGLYDFKGKGLIKTLILAPIIVPTVAVTMGIHVSFIRMGLANTFWGVVIVHLIPCIPYSVRILTDVFEIIGNSMELQARILGANKIQTFFHVTLPMLAPGLVTAGSMVFIVSFSQYFLTFLIGGGKIVTFAMLMFPFIQSGDRMMASVYSMVFIWATLLILMTVEKIVKSYYKGENYFYL